MWTTLEQSSEEKPSPCASTRVEPTGTAILSEPYVSITTKIVNSCFQNNRKTTKVPENEEEHNAVNFGKSNSELRPSCEVLIQNMGILEAHKMAATTLL